MTFAIHEYQQNRYKLTRSCLFILLTILYHYFTLSICKHFLPLLLIRLFHKWHKQLLHPTFNNVLLLQQIFRSNRPSSRIPFSRLFLLTLICIKFPITSSSLWVNYKSLQKKSTHLHVNCYEGQLGAGSGWIIQGIKILLFLLFHCD